MSGPSVTGDLDGAATGDGCGAAACDASAPPNDAGSKVSDAGGPLIDSSGPPVDASTQSIDGGALPLEGGASIRSLPFSTNDLVFDPKRGVLYATMNPYGIGANGGIFDAGADAGDSVITIDPVSATVTGALPVGGRPSVLAISDDGSALYVGVGTVPEEVTGQMDWADSVRRIDLASMAVGPLVSLGPDGGLPPTAGQIAAVPGSSTQYVVSRRHPGVEPAFAGLALYDGAALMAQYNGFTAGESITFTDPSTLFGYDNESSFADLVRFSVGPTAITPGQVVPGLITGVGGRQVGGIQITSNGGWIFATDGEAVSAATMAAVGTYNASIVPAGLGGVVIPGAVLPDADGANVWFLRGADRVVLDFDRTTFLLRRSISLDPVSADADLSNASALVQWSPTGLAFRTDSAVYVMTMPPAGNVDAGPPIDASAQPIDAGSTPLEAGVSMRSLPVSTNDLVFDPTRGVLYATMNPSAGGQGNSVLTIDPASGTVTGSLLVGSNPNAVAISDDGSALYVGIDGAYSVCRVDLASMTVGPLVSLGSNDLMARTAGQIAAVPASSTQYVVSRRQLGLDPDFAGLALYDGTNLVAESPNVQSAMVGDSMTFTGPSTLFGCGNARSPSDLVQYGVTPTAITVGQDAAGLITGGTTTRITSNGGWIFATDGQAVSAATVASVGTYDLGTDPVSGAVIMSGAVLPDADGADVWFLQTPKGSPALLDFDRTTFLLRRSISLAPLAADADLPNASALVQWSPTGFAFRTMSAVYLVTVPPN